MIFPRQHRIFTFGQEIGGALLDARRREDQFQRQRTLAEEAREFQGFLEGRRSDNNVALEGLRHANALDREGVSHENLMEREQFRLDETRAIREETRANALEDASRTLEDIGYVPDGFDPETPANMFGPLLTARTSERTASMRLAAANTEKSTFDKAADRAETLRRYNEAKEVTDRYTSFEAARTKLSEINTLIGQTEIYNANLERSYVPKDRQEENKRLTAERDRIKRTMASDSLHVANMARISNTSFDNLVDESFQIRTGTLGIGTPANAAGEADSTSASAPLDEPGGVDKETLSALSDAYRGEVSRGVTIAEAFQSIVLVPDLTPEQVAEVLKEAYGEAKFQALLKSLQE